ncbi:MAG: hypothetical protein K6A80_03445 [Saccharofermentans sp.]|nr:hypothetical protein [Saccharofermentans sp.]
MAKKITSIILSLALIVSLTSCTEEESKKLTNHMTETELSRTEETAFQLLDKPWEEYKNSALADYLLARSVGYEVWTYEDWIADVNENTDENGLYYGTPKDEVIAQIEADHEAYHSIRRCDQRSDKRVPCVRRRA